MLPTVTIMFPILNFVNGKSRTYSIPLYYLLILSTYTPSSNPSKNVFGQLGKEIHSSTPLPRSLDHFGIGQLHLLEP